LAFSHRISIIPCNERSVDMIKAAAVFSDNMVLQRGKNISVWGETDCIGTVRAEINGISAETVTENGKWELLLPPMQAGGPYVMTLSLDGKEFASFANVMIGEVWLCGGQSNMELELQNAKDGKEELESLTPDMPIRFYYTNKVCTVEEAIEAEKHAGWGVCDKEGSKAWSAVGYWFAKKLSRELGVTVGLIGCNWGGTSGTNWIDEEHIRGCAETAPYMEEYDRLTKDVPPEEQKRAYDEYCEYDRKWNEQAMEYYKLGDRCPPWSELEKILGKNLWPGPRNDFNPFSPAKMFNSMLMRVCPYTLAGFLYYQGESDDHRPKSYYTLLTMLIRVWRECWGDDGLPFIMVQLPCHRFRNDPDFKNWAIIREAQMRTYLTVKNTGLAVALDCGEFNNIHPLDKKPVGDRLCLQAEKLVYGMDVKADAPRYESYTVKGSVMTVNCVNAGEGLEAIGDKLTGFEIAGRDKVFYPAAAGLEGSCIILSSDKVTEPLYARYAWGNYPEFSVRGSSGLPLAPFRTSRNDE